MTATPIVVLDLSRLWSRVLHRAPTGVDRVEFEYARQLIDLEEVRFRLTTPLGRHGRLARADVRRFLDTLESAWDAPDDGRPTWRGAWSRWRTMRLRPVPAAERVGPSTIVWTSPAHLHRPRRLQAALSREGASVVALIHDLIPIEYPEYARPGGAATHARRLATLLGHARGLVANSAATAESVRRSSERGADAVPILVNPLGTHAQPLHIDPAAPDRPYFLFVGTIEPRKNHLLLLQLWRDLAVDHAAGRLSVLPRLVLVGRRGWENEQVLDLLDRCPALADVVEERGSVPDTELSRLMAAARAVVLPSFAEGYGMPVAEAMAAGTPVLCSDLPALREAGDGRADTLHPLDGAAWRRAIEDYARHDSPARAAQVQRLRGFRATTWREHVDRTLAFVQELEHG